jgi:hypothetical protein
VSGGVANIGKGIWRSRKREQQGLTQMNDDIVVDLKSERRRRALDWKLRDFEQYEALLYDLLAIRNKYGCRDDTFISALADALVITGTRANCSSLLLLKILSIELKYQNCDVDGVPAEWMEDE